MKWKTIIAIMFAAIMVGLLIPISVRNDFSPYEEVYLDYLRNRGSSPQIDQLMEAKGFGYFARRSMIKWKDKIVNGAVPGAVDAVELVIFAKGSSPDIGCIGVYIFPVDKDSLPLDGYLHTLGRSVDCNYRPRWNDRFELRCDDLAHNAYVNLCEAIANDADTSEWQNTNEKQITLREFPAAQHAEISRSFHGRLSTIFHRL